VYSAGIGSPSLNALHESDIFLAASGGAITLAVAAQAAAITAQTIIGKYISRLAAAVDIVGNMAMRNIIPNGHA
jgi:hypothetical protein